MSNSILHPSIREALIEQAVEIIDTLSSPTDTFLFQGVYEMTGEDIADCLIDALDSTDY